MVLPSSPPDPMITSNILSAYGITPATTKTISGDLFPLVGGTAGTTCKIGASFSGRAFYKNCALISSATAVTCKAVYVDSSSSVYICFDYSTQTNVTLSNFAASPSGTAGTITSSATISTSSCIAKWNSSGTYIGAACITTDGTSGGGQCFGVISDSSGNSYMCGYYFASGTRIITNFATNPSGTAGTLPSALFSSGTFFIVKWNSAGTFVGSALIKNTDNVITQGFGLSVDSSNNIYVCGNYGSVATPITNFATSPSGTAGTLPATASTKTGGFIAKWNLSGVYQSSAVVIGADSEIGRGIKIDGSNNIYLAGTYGPSLATISNFAVNPSGTAGTLPATLGLTAGFIVKWDSTGNYQGSAFVNSTGADVGLNVNNDSSGNVYLCGNYGTTAAAVSNFAVNPSGTAGTIKATTGSTAAYIVKWDSTGNYQGSAYVDSTAADQGAFLACDGSGNVYLVGYYGSTTAAAAVSSFAVNPTVTAGTIKAVNVNSGFIVKWNQAGVLKACAYIDSQIRCISINSSNNIYMIGSGALSNFAIPPTVTDGTVTGAVFSVKA